MQAARVVDLLEAILARLDAFAAVPEDTGCQHPEEQRISMSSFGDLNHWVCRVCRFDNKQDEALEAQTVQSRAS